MQMSAPISRDESSALDDSLRRVNRSKCEECIQHAHGTLLHSQNKLLVCSYKLTNEGAILQSAILSVCLSVSLPLFVFTACLSVSLPLFVCLFSLPACLPACLSLCLPACLSFCWTVFLSVGLSASLSVCLPACLSRSASGSEDRWVLCWCLYGSE